MRAWQGSLLTRQKGASAPDAGLRPPVPLLLVVDVQEGFDDEVWWGERNNPDCEKNIARLLHAWTVRSWPVAIVRHDSDEPGSPLQPSSPGNQLKQLVRDIKPSVLVVKSVHSAFHGTPPLDVWSRAHHISEIFVCGITTNHCCETTTRVGCDLGFTMSFVIDATHTFAREYNGIIVPAEDLSRITATNLHQEFATVLKTDTVLSALC